MEPLFTKKSNTRDEVKERQGIRGTGDNHSVTSSVTPPQEPIEPNSADSQAAGDATRVTSPQR